MDNVISYTHNSDPGRAGYNREEIFLWMYEHSDSRGIIVYNQRQVAQLLDISYQHLCYIYKDFVDVGLLKKHGSRYFEVVPHPEDVVWDEAFNERLRKLNERSSSRLRKKNNKGVLNE